MIRILAAAVLLLGVLAVPAGAREFKEFKDIVVSCTDGLTCSVSLKVQGTPGELNTLSFTRRAGPGTGTRSDRRRRLARCGVKRGDQCRWQAGVGRPGCRDAVQSGLAGIQTDRRR